MVQVLFTIDRPSAKYQRIKPLNAHDWSPYRWPSRPKMVQALFTIDRSFIKIALTLILPLRFSPKYFLTLFSAIRFSPKKSLPIFLTIGFDQLLTGSSGRNVKCVYFKLLYNSCYVFLLLLSYICLVVKLF